MPSKILFILHLPPPVHGASMVGKYIAESVPINTTFDTEYINLSTSDNLKGIGGMSVKKLVKLLGIQANVISALSKKKYDLCYMTLTSSGPGFYKDLMVVFILKLFGKKIIYHFHNKGVASAAKGRIINSLYRFAFKNTFNILLSPYLYPDMKDYVMQKNVFYCPNGIPENRAINDAVQSEKEVNGICRLLFLGNMMPSKGVHVLLEACRVLKRMSVSFECHFVGGWAEIEPDVFEKQISEYGLTNTVFSHGPKYNQEKQAFLADCDIFIFPTFYHFEAFPLVVLEAMQYRLPVISCPEGGIPDIVVEGVTGFLVPQQNIEVLTERIKTLIDNPELRIKMGAAGRNRFDELYKLDTFEHNMTNILATAISTTPVT